MINLNSARDRARTPHATETTNQLNFNSSIKDALRRRAQAVIKNKSIDSETRAMIRFCLEMDDPWLAELVRRVEAGEAIVDTASLQVSEAGEDDSTPVDLTRDDPSHDERTEQKIQALAEMVCQAGDEAAVALLVLMGMVEKAEHPRALANVTKHFVFTRCGELNLNGMVDAQIALLEDELLAQ